MQLLGPAWTAWINHHKEPPLLLPLSHARDSEHRRRRRTHSLGASECSGQVLGDLDEPSQASLPSLFQETALCLCPVLSNK